MAYEYVKAKGRVAIIKNGEFDHQQFKGHWAYARPQEYIAHLEALNAEAAAEKAAIAIERKKLADEIRSARTTNRETQLTLFA